MRRRTVMRLLLAPMVVIGAAVIIGFLTRECVDPRLNMAYQAWRIYLAPFSPKYADAIARDPHWRGTPIEELRRRTGVLYESTTFPADSYRGEFARHEQATKPGEKWCAVVQAGQIIGFVMVKG